MLLGEGGGGSVHIGNLNVRFMLAMLSSCKQAGAVQSGTGQRMAALAWQRSMQCYVTSMLLLYPVLAGLCWTVA